MDYEETASLDAQRVVGLVCPSCGFQLHILQRFCVDGAVCPKCSSSIKIDEDAMEEMGSDEIRDVLSTVFEPIDGGLTISAFLNDRQREAGDAPQRPPISAVCNDGMETIAHSPDNRYTVSGLIGSGGMGTVLAAKDMSIHRTVAMKVLNRDRRIRQDDLLRFIGEAQVTGQLEHPGILPVYELGVDSDDNVFYTMKYAKGLTLKEILDEIAAGDKEMIQKFPLSKLIDIYMKICDGMAYAHSRGVIHRDLKPANVVVGDYGEALILDWGLAKFIFKSDDKKRRFGRQEAIWSVRRDEEVCTLTGTVLGTPSYMSPEQAKGEVNLLDPRSDIYSLGAILYVILSLRLPIEAKSLKVLFAMLVNGVVKPVEEHNVAGANDDTPDLAHCPGNRIPSSLGAIAMKCLSLSPNERYQSVKDIQADIAAWQTGRSTTAEQASLFRETSLLARRHVGAITAVLVTAALLIVTVGVLTAKTRRELDDYRQSSLSARDRTNELTQALAAARERSRTVSQTNSANEETMRTMLEEGQRRRLDAYGERIRLASVFASGTGSDARHGLETLLRCDPNQRHLEWHYLKNSMPTAERVRSISLANRTATIRNGLMLPDGTVVWPNDLTRTLLGMAFVTGRTYELRPGNLTANWDGTFLVETKADSISVLNANGRLDSVARPPPGDRLAGVARISRSGKLVIVNILSEGERRIGIFNRDTRHWTRLAGWLGTGCGRAPWHSDDDKIWADGKLVPLSQGLSGEVESRQYFLRRHVIVQTLGKGYAIHPMDSPSTPAMPVLEIADPQTLDPLWCRVAHDNAEKHAVILRGSSWLCVYRLRDGALAHKFSVDQTVLGVGMSGDGQRILLMTADGRLQIHTPEGREILSIKIRGARPYGHYMIRPTRNGRHLLIASQSGHQLAIIVR